MALTHRLAALERVGGSCPVCRGRPPTRVVFRADPLGRPPQTVAACPGCGRVGEVTIAYVRDWPDVGHGGRR